MINWPAIIVVGTLVLILIVLIARRNQRDERNFERQQNEDYPRHREHTDDTGTGDRN